jgi:hypothetical protein
MQGYYDFSQKLKRIARLPFATIAYGEKHLAKLCVLNAIIVISDWQIDISFF